MWHFKGRFSSIPLPPLVSCLTDFIYYTARPRFNQTRLNFCNFSARNVFGLPIFAVCEAVLKVGVRPKTLVPRRWIQVRKRWSAQFGHDGDSPACLLQTPGSVFLLSFCFSFFYARKNRVAQKIKVIHSRRSISLPRADSQSSRLSCVECGLSNTAHLYESVNGSDIEHLMWIFFIVCVLLLLPVWINEKQKKNKNKTKQTRSSQ